jgi:hypothetical protein
VSLRASAWLHAPGEIRIDVPAAGAAEVEVVLQPDTSVPDTIYLDRHRGVDPAAPPPMYILDGERVFVVRHGCEEIPPSVRTIERLPDDEIEEIEVLKGPEAVARSGAEAEAGVIVIRTRTAPPPR